MGKPKIDIAGQRFNRLVAIEPVKANKHGQMMWRFRCDCGSETIAQGSQVKSGNTTSCGCRQRTVNLSHGCSQKKNANYASYGSWRNAWNRCNSPKCPDYPLYGGRGVQMRFSSFEALIAEIGFKPSPDLSLDRIDGEGHYEPGNVRWATAEVQALNQKRLSKSNTSGYRGVAKSCGGWQANITSKNVQYHLGSNFLAPEDAARAYDAKAIELHGEHARLNFPPRKSVESVAIVTIEATA